jgi:hypothetical protein
VAVEQESRAEHQEHGPLELVRGPAETEHAEHGGERHEREEHAAEAEPRRDTFPREDRAEEQSPSARMAEEDGSSAEHSKPLAHRVAAEPVLVRRGGAGSVHAHLELDPRAAERIPAAITPAVCFRLSHVFPRVTGHPVARSAIRTRFECRTTRSRNRITHERDLHGYSTLRRARVVTDPGRDWPIPAG